MVEVYVGNIELMAIIQLQKAYNQWFSRTNSTKNTGWGVKRPDKTADI